MTLESEENCLVSGDASDEFRGLINGLSSLLSTLRFNFGLYYLSIVTVGIRKRMDEGKNNGYKKFLLRCAEIS